MTHIHNCILSHWVATLSVNYKKFYELVRKVVLLSMRSTNWHIFEFRPRTFRNSTLAVAEEDPVAKKIHFSNRWQTDNFGSLLPLNSIEANIMAFCGFVSCFFLVA